MDRAAWRATVHAVAKSRTRQQPRTQAGDRKSTAERQVKSW